jgi:RecA-family ATPase
MKEAHAQAYPAKAAASRLRELWLETGDPRRPGHDKGEFGRMLADAVANANADDPIQRREIMARDWSKAQHPEAGDPTQPDETAINKELLRLNTQAEARRRRNLSGWIDPPDQGNATSQYLHRPPTPDWVIKELITPRSRILVNAQWKTGKTTLGVNLMHSLVTGSDFLRRFGCTEPLDSVAYWNHEVDQATFIGWLHDRGLTDPDEPFGRRIHPLHTRDFTTRIDFANPAAIDWAVKWLEQRGVRFWFIDTLSRLYTGSEKENDEITRWWDAMNEIAARAGVQNIAIFHHTGYSEEAQDRGRGASALMGLPDVLVSYRHNGKPGEFPPDDVRWLKAFGRNVSLDEIEIGYAGDASRELFATGTGNKRANPGVEKTAREVALYLRDVDKGQQINQSALCRALNLRQSGSGKAHTDAALAFALERQWIACTPKGTAKVYVAGQIRPETMDAKIRLNDLNNVL